MEAPMQGIQRPKLKLFSGTGATLERGKYLTKTNPSKHEKHKTYNLDHSAGEVRTTTIQQPGAAGSVLNIRH